MVLPRHRYQGSELRVQVRWECFLLLKGLLDQRGVAGMGLLPVWNIAGFAGQGKFATSPQSRTVAALAQRHSACSQFSSYNVCNEVTGVCQASAGPCRPLAVMLVAASAFAGPCSALLPASPPAPHAALVLQIGPV